MILTDTMYLIVAAIMAGITFIVSSRVLAKTMLHGIGIPIAVAGLAFFGLLTHSSGLIAFVLNGYAALALSLFCILVAMYLFKIRDKVKNGSSHRKPWQSSK